MAIAHRGTSSGAALNDSSASVSPPTGTSSGDLMLLFCGGYNDSGGSLSTPSGWTVLTAFHSSEIHYCWYKVAGSSETSVSIGGDNNVYGACIMDVYSGVDTTNPIVAHGGNSWANVSHSSGTTSPSVNNTVSGSTAVFMGAFSNNFTGDARSTPTGMTAAADFFTSVSDSVAFSFYKNSCATGSQSYTTDATTTDDYIGGTTLVFLRVASSGTSADASLASSSSAGENAAAQVGGNAGQAQATAAALDASTGVQVNAGTAQATAAGQDATVSSAPSTSASAGVAAATAAGLDAAPTGVVNVSAGSAGAAAAGLDAGAAVAVNAPAARAACASVGYDPAANVATHASFGLAAAAGYDATVSVLVETSPDAGLAAAAASAFDATTNAVSIITPAERIYVVSREARAYVIVGDW